MSADRIWSVESTPFFQYNKDYENSIKSRKAENLGNSSRIEEEKAKLWPDKLLFTP